MRQKRVIVVQDRIHIAAPLERMFALSTSVPLVQQTLGFKPVEGVTTGHVEMGSRVLWKGWLFGLPQRHLTLITGYKKPHRDADGIERAFFQDTQESGRFHSFQHDHHMSTLGDGSTLLQDEIRYVLPFGYIGWLVAHHVMEPFIQHTLRSRFRLLQTVATGSDWQKYA